MNFAIGRRERFRNGFVRCLPKKTLAGQNIDDNDNAFKLIKQLNTCYKH